VKRLLLNPEVGPVWDSNNDTQLLAAYQQVWNRKTVLRRLYETWYERILAKLKPGSMVEIGAGTGNFKRWLQSRGRRVWTLDILAGHAVDVQADALWLPVRDGCLDNIVMIDALHHLAQPFTFLRRAAQALRAGGRIIFVEPFVSAWGRFVYGYLHHERVDFDFEESSATKQAWDGNAAIPQLVLQQLASSPSPLRLVSLDYCEFLAYPLSGGFSYRSVLPAAVLLALHRLERARVFQTRALALRVIVVLEKAA